MATTLSERLPVQGWLQRKLSISILPSSSKHLRPVLHVKKKKITFKILIISAESVLSHFSIQSAVIKYSVNTKLGRILCK